MKHLAFAQIMRLTAPRKLLKIVILIRRNKKMKKIGIICIAIMMLTFVACNQNEQKKPDTDTNPKQEAEAPIVSSDNKQVKIPEEAIAAIGKTYNELKNDYPNYIPDNGDNRQFTQFYDSAFPYLGILDAKYKFVFYGTQWGPSLEDVSKYYGSEIKCIGLTGDVGNLFPEITSDLSFDEFFSLIDVNEYDYNDKEDSSAYGELSFKYEEFDIVINTTDPKDARVIKINYPILITEGDIMQNNDYIEKTEKRLNPNAE
jgi:hypothetical protein